ncbi:hypothetical protein, conserved [Babesia bigemina]|uniref:Uncharacterized protein n=1 Tax=Babesia bigemina TaxID=5866 RepID=A0A061DDR8_BABBI|nr:hypothetical protein, conserved [Babesia bigemina]CDR97639.1 hypothetical protein, conserved [Babesia bigemina]|eukprot:XP_012769825.1 hypothetical protein, conserved [Babesia bigemina]
MEQSYDSTTTLQQFQLLQETQAQIEVLNTQINKINKRIGGLQVGQKRCEAALESLENTQPGQRVYKQVSRVLILRDPSELQAEITSERESAAKDLPKLTAVKAQLVAKLGGQSSVSRREPSVACSGATFGDLGGDSIMLHILLVLCVITCICDLFGAGLRRVSALLQALEERRAAANPAMFNSEGQVPTMTDIAMRFIASKLNIYKILRMIVGLIGVLSNIILPYYLLSRFTKTTNASYHRQTYSYMPFMIVDFERVPVSEIDLAEVPTSGAKKPEDINVLTSFNRYIAFMVSRVAMKAIYSTFYAACNPAGYLEQMMQRDKETKA